VIVLAGVPSWALAGGLARADAPRGANAAAPASAAVPAISERRDRLPGSVMAASPSPNLVGDSEHHHPLVIQEVRRARAALPSKKSDAPSHLYRGLDLRGPRLGRRSPSASVAGSRANCSMMNLEAALDGGDVGPQLIGLARGQRVFARHTAVCQTVVARWLGCRQLPFAGLRANSRSRPFSVTQLRIRNGSSCPIAAIA
jgi:hypothetical protein